MSSTIPTPRPRTLSLQEMAIELERRQAAKRDYVIDTRRASFITEDGVSTLTFDAPDAEDGIDGGPVLDHAHAQIAERLQIPKRYYDRLRSTAPKLLDANVGHWFVSEPEKRTVRILDDRVRAVLSNRYRRLDDYDLMQHVLPIFGQIEGLEFQRAALTDTRLHVRALLPSLQAEVGLGDIVQAGVALRNSEVGDGALVVEPFIWRLACLNGMTVPDRRLRKFHTGRAEDEGQLNVYSDETLAADDRAFFLKVGDLVKAALSEVTFEQVVAQLREAATGEKIADPVEATTRLASSFTLTQGEQKGVLQHLIEGGDLSRYGLIQAVTRTAQDTDTFERQAEMEEIGGNLLAVSGREWRELAVA